MKKNWINPEVQELELEKTQSPIGGGTCGYQGNTSKCPDFKKRNESTLELSPDDAVTYNNCIHSWGHDCKLVGTVLPGEPEMGIPQTS